METTPKPRYKKPDAVHNLEEAIRQRRIATHPHIPPAYIKRQPMRDDTANGLTKCVVSFLNVSGHQAERINTTGRVIMERGQMYRGGRLVDTYKPRMIPTAGQRGSADISATIDGRSVKIEIKVGRDRQSDAQKEYQRSIEAAGGIYVIVRDFPSFVEWYETTFHRAAFPHLATDKQ